MASLITATSRGLAAVKIAPFVYTSMRNVMGAGFRDGRSIMSVRRLARTKPKGSIGFSTTTSNRAARIQQHTTSASTSTRSSRTNQSILQQIRNRLFHTTRRRRASEAPNPTPHLGSPNENSSIGQRLRKLIREYGWSALGVYLALSALDFPFCYLLVRYLGTDLIGKWEHIIVSNIKRIIPETLKSRWHEWREAVKQAERERTGQEAVTEHIEMAGWGVEEAQEQNTKYASLATQLAFAYAIHKTFIFVRVPLTAAVTPKVVKVLREWGWDIGKRTSKEARAIKRAAASSKKQ